MYSWLGGLARSFVTPSGGTLLHRNENKFRVLQCFVIICWLLCLATPYIITTDRVFQHQQKKGSLPMCWQNDCWSCWWFFPATSTVITVLLWGTPTLWVLSDSCTSSGERDWNVAFSVRCTSVLRRIDERHPLSGMVPPLPESALRNI